MKQREKKPSTSHPQGKPKRAGGSGAAGKLGCALSGPVEHLSGPALVLGLVVHGCLCVRELQLCSLLVPALE